MNRDQYVELLKHLFPRGAAWPREVTTGFHKLFEAMAEEFVRYDVRIGTDLLNEADPQTTVELLAEWERIVRLPDDFQTELRTSAGERREDILRKLTFRGGQSRQFFVDLAAAFGYTVTIEETFPFRAGRARAGDRCYDVDWIHHWRVIADSADVILFRAGESRAGDRLAVWSNETLELVFAASKPAQTTVHFVYGG